MFIQPVIYVPRFDLETPTKPSSLFLHKLSSKTNVMSGLMLAKFVLMGGVCTNRIKYKKTMQRVYVLWCLMVFLPEILRTPLVLLYSEGQYDHHAIVSRGVQLKCSC